MISIRKLFLCEMATSHFPEMSFWEKSSWQNLDLQVQYVSLWDFSARINYSTNCHQLQKQDRDVACQGSQLALRPLEKKISSFLSAMNLRGKKKHYEEFFLAADSHKCNNSRGRHWPHFILYCDIVLCLYCVWVETFIVYVYFILYILCNVFYVCAVIKVLAANTI